MKHVFAPLALIAVGSACPEAWAEETQPRDNPYHDVTVARFAPSAAGTSAAGTSELATSELATSKAATSEAAPSSEAGSASSPGHTHTRGEFFLGLRLPVGYRETREESAEGDAEFSGVGAGFGFQIGGTVARNLVLFADFSGSNMSDPKVTRGGESLTAEGFQISASGIGAGALYYLMPLNVYFGGSVLAASIGGRRVVDGDVIARVESTTGLGLIGRAGKEFWISESWGLGLGLEAQYITGLKSKGGNLPLTGTALSAVVSASYN